MNKEKIILIFAAVLIGLGVAGLGFYFYQSAKVLPPQESKSKISLKPSPPPKASVILSLAEPKDEEVVDSKILKISGKTDPNAVVVIITGQDEEALNPSKTGDFSTTVTLDNGANLIQVTALSKNGETSTIKRTVTYSIENF